MLFTKQIFRKDLRAYDEYIRNVDIDAAVWQSCRDDSARNSWTSFLQRKEVKTPLCLPAVVFF